MMAENSLAQTLPSPHAQQKSPTSKQVLAWGLLLLTATLIFLQWRSWHSFDWRSFFSETAGLSWVKLSLAVGLSLLTFPLRAWRWQIFLRPMCEAKLEHVLSPTLIGFTGLAVLGRPGELVRPYMIARRTNLTMASQMGVWMVERIFDMGAFLAMAAVTFFAASGVPDLRQFRVAAWSTAGIIVGMAFAAVVMCKTRRAIFSWLERVLATRYPAVRGSLRRAQAFTDGLHTVKDSASFVQLSLLSIAIWVLTAFSYTATLQAYPSIRNSSFSVAMLLMGFSMIGGLVQLPAVGGGAQLATIVAMVDLLGFPREFAVSAGILLWLVSFHAVTPIGLILARRAHVSLTNTSADLTSDDVQKTSSEANKGLTEPVPIENSFSNPCYQESGNA